MREPRWSRRPIHMLRSVGLRHRSRQRHLLPKTCRCVNPVRSKRQVSHQVHSVLRYHHLHMHLRAVATGVSHRHHHIYRIVPVRVLQVFLQRRRALLYDSQIGVAAVAVRVGQHRAAQVGYQVFTFAGLGRSSHRSDCINRRLARRELDVYLLVYRVFVAAQIRHHIVSPYLVSAGHSFRHHAVAARERKLAQWRAQVRNRHPQRVLQSCRSMHRRVRISQHRKVAACLLYKSAPCPGRREGRRRHIAGMYRHAVRHRAAVVVHRRHTNPIVNAADVGYSSRVAAVVHHLRKRQVASVGVCICRCAVCSA